MQPHNWAACTSQQDAHLWHFTGCSTEFPTSRLEMSAVADIFDRDGDGYIDYYEFVAALHPNKDAYKPLTDADKIEDEVIWTHKPRIYKSRDTTTQFCGALKSASSVGHTSSSKMQMSQTIPSGTNWCQQIPGKETKLLHSIISNAMDVKPFKYCLLNFMEKSCRKVVFECASKKVHTVHANNSNFLSLLLFFTSPVLPWKPGTSSCSLPYQNFFIYHVCCQVNTMPIFLADVSWLMKLRSSNNDILILDVNHMKHLSEICYKSNNSTVAEYDEKTRF